MDVGILSTSLNEYVTSSRRIVQDAAGTLGKRLLVVFAAELMK